MISAGFEMQFEAVFVQSSLTANHVFVGALSLFSVSICSDALWIKLLGEVYPRISSVVGGLPGPEFSAAAGPMRTKSSCSWGSSAPTAGASAPDSGDMNQLNLPAASPSRMLVDPIPTGTQVSDSRRGRPS